MNEPLKKPGQVPESYQPKKPEMMRALEEAQGQEKVIDTIVIEGVEFTIIEKGRTLYAGKYAVEPGIEPDGKKIGFDDVYGTDQQILFQENPLHDADETVQGILTPDRMIVLNIDYTTGDRPCAMLRGHETTCREQPEGVHVIEAEPTLLIKTSLTHAAYALMKKLMGQCLDQYHMSKLFDLIKRIFCEGEDAEYEYNGDNGTGNADAEHFPFRGAMDGMGCFPHAVTNGYVTVPVKRRSGGAGVKRYDHVGLEKVADKPNAPAVWTHKEIASMQAVPMEFKKMRFGRYTWLIMEERDGKALIVSEKILMNKQYVRSKEKVETTWSQCDLRRYLNNQFYRSFRKKDRARISKTKLPPYVNPWYGLSNGKSRFVRLREKDNAIYLEASKSTDDFIFVLSVEEIVKYFGDSGALDKRIGYTWAGEEHKDCFMLVDGFGQFLIDQYSRSRIAKDRMGKARYYWTRTPGSSPPLTSAGIFLKNG